MFRLLLESTVVLVAIVFVNQVCWPMIMGRQIFPLFRRERKLKAELSNVRQQLHEAELEKELAAERSKLTTEEKEEAK